jgi:hypothetical protein
MSRQNKKPDFSRYKEASAIGTGIWFMEHLKTAKANTVEDINNIFSDILLLRAFFSCDVCKAHLNSFCVDHDPTQCRDDDIRDIQDGIRPENLGRWLVDAHNNATKNKYEKLSQINGVTFRPDDVKYEDVRDFMDSLGQEPCNKDCDTATSSPSTNQMSENREEIPIKNIKIFTQPTSKSNKESGTNVVSGRKNPLRLRIVSNQQY